MAESAMTAAKVEKRATRMDDALAKSARFLADANLAQERGDDARAEKLYDKAQYWLDRYNSLTGRD